MQALIANPYAGEVGGLTRWMATAHAPAVGPPGAGVAAGRPGAAGGGPLSPVPCMMLDA